MKKIICLVLAVLMCLTCFVGCGNKPASDLTKLNVAYHTNLGGSAIVVTGNQQKIWEKYGFELNLTGFTSGPVEIAAMLSGELDYGYIGPGAHTLAIGGKVDVIAYEKIGDDEAIITSKDKNITTLSDLKGKKVGTTLGTSGENVLRAALTSVGLTDKDVEIVNMDMGACVVAMSSGQIDAVCVYAQYRTTVISNLGDKAVVLAKTSSFDSLCSPASWIATPEYIKRNYDQTVSFVAATIECIDFFAKNRETVAQYAADFLGLEYATVVQSVNGISLYTIEEYEAALNDGTIAGYYQSQQNNFLKNGNITEGAPIEDYVRLDVLKDAIALIKTKNA